jgi:hypothetical protein
MFLALCRRFVMWIVRRKASPKWEVEKLPDGSERECMRLCERVWVADEYDAAQGRGDVVGPHSSKILVGDGDQVATVSDIGLTHKDIHEARQIRDAGRQG